MVFLRLEPGLISRYCFDVTNDTALAFENVGAIAGVGVIRGNSVRQRLGLEVMQDAGGVIHMGWVAPGVLFARFTGGLSATLGAEFAARLTQQAESVPSLAYYSDASGLTHYDLLARSAFVRAVMSQRKKFTEIVLLTWAEGISSTMKDFAAVIGEPIAILAHSAAFESRLFGAAPLAAQVIFASGPRPAAR